MAAKPDSCKGCPFYGDGRGFVPDEIREGAAVFTVGQNPGEQEEAEGKPFVGKTGQTMEKYLKDAGLTRDDVSIGNAIRCRWKGTNELPEIRGVLLRDALAWCARKHLRIPPATRLIVSQGDYAALQLTGGTVTDGDKSTGWRGYLRPMVGTHSAVLQEPWVPTLHDLPVLVTVHLARLFREPWYTLPTRLDWAKIPRILKGTWPRRPPTFNLTPPEAWPEVFAFDTEFWHEEGHAPTSAKLIRWSASWGAGDGETCVVEVGAHTLPRRDGQRSRVITQYAPADVHHLARLTNTSWGPSPSIERRMARGDGVTQSVWDQFLIEDTVWKHAVLWSDHPHDLNYLGSLYAPFNRWKHLADRDPILYSGLDALGLFYIDQALERELDSDPRSEQVWRTMDRPALGEFVRAQYRGLRVNPERVRDVLSQANTIAQDAKLKAQALAGWPISLASNPQVAHEIYEIQRLRKVR